MNKFRVIGLMSGTSLDGLDICFVEFTQQSKKWQFKTGAGTTINYKNEFKEQLKNARSYTAEQLAELHVNFGRMMGAEVKKFIAKNKLKVDLISSHGHTIFHQPEKGITVQIGSLNEIFAATKIKTVGDFRTLDVALGGQGAPLVPIGDELLFHDFENCLNLGGIANVSYNKKGKRLAFDICPVNIVMNFLAEKLGAAYDNGGKFAASGKANKALLEQLNKVEFYSLKAPKSLGIEYIEENYFPLIKASKVSVEDKLCTMVEHIAMQIASNLQKGKVLVTGGGAKNSFLISRLKHHYKGEVVVPANEVIDFKEAIIFAFLGVLRTLNLSNCLSSVTGAKYDCSGGVIIEG